jgi:hypothetical protein
VSRSSRLSALAAFALLLLAALAAPSPARAGVIAFNGMVSSWFNLSFAEGSNPVAGVRFIPELSLSLKAGKKTTLDLDLSANAFGTADFSTHAESQFDGDIKPYRAWVRLAGSQVELRAGLQKIDFGSATLLRPLMWFDSVDPRDPLQITDGVYALLFRAYSVKNTNLWLWGLYGNTDPRGWDLLPTASHTAEFGGRIQVPLFKGELAATYHHRQADINGFSPVAGPAAGPLASVVPSATPSSASPVPLAPVPEDRVGLDGKWDLGIGLWFEGDLVHQHTTLLPAPYTHALTLGADYTFGLGRGLTAIAEHFLLESSATALGSGQGARVTALLLRYPLGVMDEISGIFYYDWENKNFNRFLSWQHTTDRSKIFLMLFWNPADMPIYPGVAGNSFFLGTGFQLQWVYNF